MYAYWVVKLRELSLDLVYIPGPRNKVADGLSRVLFYDKDCQPDRIVQDAHKAMSRDSQWIWKDGKGGFEWFLQSLTDREQQEIATQDTFHCR